MASESATDILVFLFLLLNPSLFMFAILKPNRVKIDPEFNTKMDPLDPNYG